MSSRCTLSTWKGNAASIARHPRQRARKRCSLLSMSRDSHDPSANEKATEFGDTGRYCMGLTVARARCGRRLAALCGAHCHALSRSDRDSGRLVWVKRALVFAAIAAAAGLAWASTGRFEPLGSSSNQASVSLDESAGNAALAVIETTRSPIVRALSDSKASRVQLPWDLLAACGLTAIAVGLTWSRRHRSEWWSFAPGRLLGRAVPVRAPPLSHLV